MEFGQVTEHGIMGSDTARAAAQDLDLGATEARVRAEHVARESYGRLLAFVAAPSGDLEQAEDALADAFEQALRTWPESGVPDKPEAWLLTVARNRLRDVFKSAAYRRSVPLDAQESGLTATTDVGVDAIPDRRLALLFVCAHPAIEMRIRTPLMLQTVLGFEAKQIARAFAMPASTMAQRLVRAKRRIRDVRIPFVVPERTMMRPRLDAVLEAVYGAYAIDWQVIPGTMTRGSLASEAHYLAVTLAELLGDESEAFGLAALLSLSISRSKARGTAGEFVPLEEQDTTLWDTALIAQGERYLRRAHAIGRPGRFQLEAAIQSVHCNRAVTGVTDWGALRKLYAGLVRMAPTLGSRVALAATIGRTDAPEAGLAALDAISEAGIKRFQPASATRARLLDEAGRAEEAERAYAKAISLTTERGIRDYLKRKRSDARLKRSEPGG